MLNNLYSLEDNILDKGKDLLIDKVISYSEQEKSPVTLTADILNQRKKLKEEISKQLNQDKEESEDTKEESEDKSEDTTEDKDKSEDTTEDKDESKDTVEDKDKSEDTTENKDESEDIKDNSEDTKEESKDTKDTTKDKDEEDITVHADNEESLKSLMGSGLKELPSKKTSTESFTKLTLANIFSPINKQYIKYTTTLESYNLSNKKLSIEEQPIVYIKESVIKSLNNLITLANNYIDNNTTFIKKVSVSAKDINEKLTILREVVENSKFHFTNKIVNDKDIISNISVHNDSNPIETSRALLKYIDQSTKTNVLIMNNDFSKISSSYISSNFEKENNDLVYKSVLPGFNIIRVHLDNYINYLKTNIQEFHYYKVKVLKTEDLYDLDGITITEDKELIKLLDLLDKLLVNITLTTDNLVDINKHFTKFIDEIKVIVFDIEKDKYKNLASIGIDDKVKDFIKFKLVIESSYININMILDHITTVMSLINVFVDIKQ